jgi:hypothetical protein
LTRCAQQWWKKYITVIVKVIIMTSRVWSARALFRVQCLRSVVNSFFGFATSVRFAKTCRVARGPAKSCKKSVSHHWVHVNRVVIFVRVGTMCERRCARHEFWPLRDCIQSFR